MTMDDFMRAILEIAPDAIFDQEYRSGEIMISTGLALENGQVVKLLDL
jgi:hypothetical protein